MCGGAEFLVKNEIVKVFFPNPKATLPVVMKNGEPELIPWGRRQDQPGSLPLGGWARLDSIRAGKWNYLNPKPVKLAIHSFMEKDKDKNSHWFDLQEHEFLQGLFVFNQQEQRVYVVTTEAPEETRDIHLRWPRIISANEN